MRFFGTQMVIWYIRTLFSNQLMLPTFATCFYEVKSKFSPEKYYKWMENLLLNTKCFNLIVFTDSNSNSRIEEIVAKSNFKQNIKIIIKPLETFYNYKYKDYFIYNQAYKSQAPNISWELQMIWAEKASFVLAAATEIPNSSFYGWVDIGYFRGRENDIPTSQILNWPSLLSIIMLDPNKVYYANVSNSPSFDARLSTYINDKQQNGLPKFEDPPNSPGIAGGFFICHKSQIGWWRDKYDEVLGLYATNKFLMRDDQTIINYCVYTYPDKFQLSNECDEQYDNWFMFQRLLL
jgi:hypothetical protein